MTNFRKCAAGCSIMFCALTCMAQDLSFKGVALGALKEELLAKFPSLRCEKPMRSASALGEEVCAAPVSASLTGNDRSLYSYADRPAWDASFSIVGGRFEGFRIIIRPESYEAVRNALQSVYGSGDEEREQLMTGGGVPVSSRRWEAITPKGSIGLGEHGTQIDEGFAGASSNTYLDYVSRIRRGNPAAGRKDL